MYEKIQLSQCFLCINHKMCLYTDNKITWWLQLRFILTNYLFELCDWLGHLSITAVMLVDEIKCLFIFIDIKNVNCLITSSVVTICGSFTFVNYYCCSALISASSQFFLCFCIVKYYGTYIFFGLVIHCSVHVNYKFILKQHLNYTLICLIVMRDLFLMFDMFSCLVCRCCCFSFMTNTISHTMF